MEECCSYSFDFAVSIPNSDYAISIPNSDQWCSILKCC
jgi:hypothetical protein